AGRALAAEHAADFYHSRLAQAQAAEGMMDMPPLFVAPFDAELFGHWWHEGVVFLEELIRKAAGHKAMEMVTAEEYLTRHPAINNATPAPSSWGLGGQSEMWLDDSNDWIYRHLHKAADRMASMAGMYSTAAPLTRRALDQAARELMLAQSSDWPFMMKTGAMKGYATRRVEDGLANFNKLFSQVMVGNVDSLFLEELENTHNLFPNEDFTVFGG
ncbi:MAG: DUF1957 domain-containing protein, partial [Nitrospinota bacterium]|nr:DUF1957 domain-containing protein [Nitrospinota bacterium]